MVNVHGPCRLPYTLLENNVPIDTGYLLSTRDLCGLDYIPFLIQAGVHCFKIEGRMKSPEYVATVTRIYRKYIDLALSNQNYVVEEKDRKELLQLFNRGMSSMGHLADEPNKELVFKEKPNNMGLFLGVVQKYHAKKGLITLKLKEPISIGDTISLEKESGSYTVSELMEKEHNITQTEINQTVTLGRMKGNISLGDKVYKMSSKLLNQAAKESYQKENKKIGLDCLVTIRQNKPITIDISSSNPFPIYKGLQIHYTLDFCPTKAKNKPLDLQTVIQQISKTTSTPYVFNHISVDLENDVFLPKLSILNELRRGALAEVENTIIQRGKRTSPPIEMPLIPITTTSSNQKETKEISLLLNILHLDWNYTHIEPITNLYIPLKYFTLKPFEKMLKILSENFPIFIYMPTIMKENEQNLFYHAIKNAIQKYPVQGFVISNISNIKLLQTLLQNTEKKFEIVTNYTFNIFNFYSIEELKKLGICRFTPSPELEKEVLQTLCQNPDLDTELIVYGRTPLLNMNYCLLGKTNKCYPDCKQKCQSSAVYELKDRLNMKFKVLPNHLQTVTTIFNSKITSISPKDFSTNFLRVDILEENIEEINHILQTVKSQKRLEGKDYTNGNLNKTI